MGSASYVFDVPRVEKHFAYDEFFRLHPSESVTVAELIAMLQQYPSDMVVCHHDDEYETEHPVVRTRLGILEDYQLHYAGEGLSSYLVGREFHTCDVVVIE
jgi:hypothetical protein